ncbi:type II CRISPR RNA-guided endonuclease Cas9 [Endomicrobium proavitum]|uniref:Putative CRISPR-associated protein Csn1 family n=1 Tax=Endomicrobium proavitum TaxID=1408281 RepID=A0A0G3WLX3_9BACT|nr:type II CRISPR RNA-guided endonuclease Cas9 [Endomicrobium proavitum]AKL98454.1 putative CRISPR-associated protein Csn1 family [Endomicrobium proavitum]
MPKQELVYSFDLGSGSIGVCVRSGKNILHLNSLLLDNEFASVKEAAAQRRQIRTRIAHKEREKWWNEQAKKAGIEVLQTAQPTKENPNLKPDSRMLIEFLPKNSKDKTIYSSHLLRIALLQGIKLESWQIYKAIRSAIQRRGYDANLPWATDYDSDTKANSDAATRYEEKLKEFFADKEEYYYPCYYEAYIQSIWSPSNPKDLSGRLSENPSPARNKDNKPQEDKCFPSRDLVEKELKDLLSAAAKLFPKLKDKENYVLYGQAQRAYASYEYKKDIDKENYISHRGTSWDWQGLLGQKVPRFDNRIIAKCRLIPRFNVCNAKKQINKEVSFLLALKNMRFTLDNTTTQSLNCAQINEIFKTYAEFCEYEKQKETAVAKKQNPCTKTFWKNYVHALGGEVNPGQQEIAKPKEGGRSSFCKPALNILHSLILSGKTPHNYYAELVEQTKNTDLQKGLIKDDYRFLLNMPNDWNSISIQDTREEDKKLSQQEALRKIDEIIAGVNNRIVCHRLLMLKQVLQKLDDQFNKEYGVPDKVVFEIAREDFMGKKKKDEYLKKAKDGKKNNDDAVKKLKDMGLPVSDPNIIKIKLGNEQKWKDIYDTSDKRNLIPENIGQYEIDHIVPRTSSKGGSDSFVNFILTKNALNQTKKDRTPYEWLSSDNSKWQAYLANIADFSKSANSKKIELLTSDKAENIEKRKTDLQATSYLEKLAQTIAGLYFGFGINTKDDKKRILFFTGGETATVRSKLDLNRVLYKNDEEFEKAQKAGLKEKNRKNKKHHALDALVLSMLPEIKVSKREIIEKPDYFHKDYCVKQLKSIIPQTIKQIKPKLRATIYALRSRYENGKPYYYFISRFNSNLTLFEKMEDAKKEITNIFDLKIKNDWKVKLEEKGLTQEKWIEFLNKYTNNGKRIKQIAMTDSKAFKKEETFNSNGIIKNVIGEYGSNGVKGQWIKGKEGHQGQIVYKDEKGKWRVEPVYVFESIYNKKKLYENKYKDVRFLKSGQLVELKKDYENIKAGIYILRTLKSNGSCKLEDINTQEEIDKSVNVLIEQCGMRSYEKK